MTPLDKKPIHHYAPDEIELKQDVTPRSIAVIRMFIASLHAILFVYLFWLYGVGEFKGLLLYLTQWGFALTFAYFATSSVTQQDNRPTRNLSPFFHVCFSLECLITLMYWMVIFPTQHSRENRLRAPSTDINVLMHKKLAQALLHTVPIACLAVDFCINKILLTIEAMWMLFALLGGYLLVNFTSVVIFGIRVYAIIDYKQYHTYLILLNASVLAWAFWKLPMHLQKHKFVVHRETSN